PGNGGNGGNDGTGTSSPANPTGGTPPAAPPVDATPGVPVLLDNNGSFKVDGLAFAPVDGDSYRQYILNLQPGVKYHRITVDFDVYINRWQTSIFQAVAGLRRSDKTLYWGLLIRVDKQ